MRLKQIIRKVLKEDLDSKKQIFLKQYYDKKFKDVSYVHKKEHNSKWINKEGKELFIRNWWGMLWVSDCDFYNDLRLRAELVEFSTEEFHQILVSYLNNIYKEDFADRKLRDVGDESNCEDLPWG